MPEGFPAGSPANTSPLAALQIPLANSRELGIHRQYSLQHLSFACRTSSAEFRACSAPDHAWANRATHWSRSCEKEAVDVRIVCDAAWLTSAIASRHDDAEILLVTDDLFGRTLAAELNAVTHVTFSGDLPLWWCSFLGGWPSFEAFFESIGV